MVRILISLFAVSILTIKIYAEYDSVSFINQESYKTFYRVAHSSLLKMTKIAAWKTVAAQVHQVKVISSIDGTAQPALFFNPNAGKKRPLLVALHSWSADYLHQYSVPFGIWAIKNGWVFIHPDYRGAFVNRNAIASELAVQDIIDAVEYAKSNADVDKDRIYLTGFSGGGMMSLIMAGRYPDLWAGVAAWVPVYDLTRWYHETKDSKFNYALHIKNACGGVPHPGSKSELECQKRSVSGYLKGAYGKNIPIYIATGINDNFVRPSHSFLAFNDLADDKDRISEEDINYIDSSRKIPAHFSGIYYDSLYDDVDLPLLYECKSNTVELKIFDGKHDIIFNAGLYWLSKQYKRKQ